MTELLSPSNSRYLIPHWFLERNVKTAAELAAAPDQIVFCTCGDCKEAKADDDGGGGADLTDEEKHDKSGPEVGNYVVKEINDSCSSSLARGLRPDEMHYKTFAELRDITAAAFVTGRDGRLSFPEASAVVLRMEMEEISDYYHTTISFMEPVWMGRAVEQVAKALGVSLVVLNLDELEELGSDFHGQDKEAQKCKTSGDVDLTLASTSERHDKDAKAKEDGSTADDISIEENGNKDQEAEEAKEVDDNNESASLHEQQLDPDMCSLSAFLGHFFAARAKRNGAAESWQRTQLVWTSILEAVRGKLATESTASEMTGGIFRQSAVIFHITDYVTYPNFDGRRLKERVLTRFAEMVHERRKQGDAVVIIVSTQDDSLEPDQRLQGKIGARPASTVVARDVKLSDADSALRKQSYRGIINARALRRCLRHCCAHLLPADVLEVTADWACTERDKSFRSFGGTMWTSTEMGRIVAQIMGRAWLKPKLTFTDVLVILKRLGLYQPVETETRGTPARSEKAEFEHNDESTTTNTFDEDVKKVLRGLNLNSHEEALTECIVEPGTLKTHWDDVIIDQGTKELMQQLVASHHLQFNCASELLRQALRIRGALLYGPPGTGKTHLSRAVATASGSRMLAVSYASLISKWVGEAEKNIEAAFTLASKLHPCVLFIDEVDSLFYRRSSGDESWERSQINQFLQQMDGLSQNDKAPLVLAATNRPWDLDEAFLRRLEHKVYLGLPDTEARTRIFRLFLHQDDLDPTIDINGLAQVTEKYSGSDIKTLCAKAGLLWEAEQARLHTLYKSVSDKFALADKAPKKVRLSIDHFTKALVEIQPSNSEDLAEGLEKFSRKHNLTASTSDKDPGIRFIYNSSTKRYDRFDVRALISRLPVSDDVPALNQGEPDNEMQLQAWCQLDLHVHLWHCLHTNLAVLLFCSQRVLEHQMQLQAWCQMDIRTHLMHRLHTNLIALLFSLHTYDHAFATLQQVDLDSEDLTVAGSNSKLRQKSGKTVLKKKSEPRESASAAETVNFRYRKLGTDEFRLLTIAPGDTDEPLVCTLDHTSFQSNRRYCALSYTWGSPEAPFFINCNGSEIRITSSLHEALSQMRRKWLYIVVWADAICINQSDNAEKSQQVMRMGDIYSKASRLFIWLGNPVTASDADVTVDTMEKVGKMAESCLENRQVAWDTEEFIVAVQERMREEPISENEWQRLQDCFLMPWFSRVWVFQEVVSVMACSAKNIRMGYGNRIVAWMTVARIMAILGPLKSVNPASIRCPAAITMERNIRAEAMMRQVRNVRIHLPNDQITEENVVEAVADKLSSDVPYFCVGGTDVHVTIVIDMLRLAFPNTNKDDYPQMDLDTEATLMMGVFLRLFPDELRALGEDLLKGAGNMEIDWLAQAALGWWVQCSPDDEFWVPEDPTVLKLRRSIGFVTATLLKQESTQSVAVGFKTANFGFMQNLRERLWPRLQLARRLGATDLRDKLYAFLGLYSEDIVDEPLLQVDYDSGVAEVYLNLTIFFLRRLMCLDVLEFVNDMPIRKPLVSLPSWAIDLSSPTDLELFQTGMHFNAGGACIVGRGRFAMHVLRVHVSEDRRRLDLNAYLVGEVTELAFLPHHRKQNAHLTGNSNRDDLANLRSAASRTYSLAFDMVNRLGQGTRARKDVDAGNPAVNNFSTSAIFDMESRLYLSGESIFDVFWRCLACDHWTYGQRRFGAPISPDEEKIQMEQAYRNYHTMMAKGSTSFDPPGGDGDATSERFGYAGSTTTEPNPGIHLFSTEFELKAQASVFGVVADELIGWFPRRAEKGDMLVILPGARCPYVLRRVRGDASMDWNKDMDEDDAAQEQDQRSEWEVIGHAYVQGLMDDIVTPWEIDLTENGRELLGKLNASGEAPAVERISLV